MIGQRGWYAWHKLVNEYEFDTVLDVGAGDGTHAKAFADAGKTVTAIDIARAPEDMMPGVSWFRQPWALLPVNMQWDAIWACHVCEHDPNPGMFLEAVCAVLSPGGVLAVTVPPAKSQLVGGHVSLWTGGLLLYRLALAGFDCSDARLLQRGYDISVIVRPAVDKPLPDLKHDSGDITRLAEAGLLPGWFEDGMDGDIDRLNWGDIAHASSNQEVSHAT